MKNKILIMTVLLVAVLALFGIASTVKAAEKTHEDLNRAISDAGDGGVLTLDPTDTYTVSSTVKINKNLTIDLNGATIKSETSGQDTILVEQGATVTFKDSKGTGKIENTGGDIALWVKGTAILDGGTYTNTSDNYGAIQVGAKDGTAGTLTVKNDGVNISGKYGISVSGDGSELTVEDGTITGTTFAISGNGADTKNATITINGGNITSTGNAAIYQPNTGTLNVSGGTVTGKIGIVARQGEVNITGGEVVGNGTKGDKIQTGDAKEDGGYTQLPVGSAIVTDNSSAGYEDATLVKITDGTLTSTAGVDSVTSYNGEDEANAEDFEISGGEFSEKFDKSFVKEGAAEVSIEKDGETTYYVGKQAKEAVETAAEGSTVTVETGKLEVDKLPSGVKLDPASASQLTVKPKAGNDTQAIKNNLQALIEKAEKVENPSEELKNAIATAKAVLENVGSTYGEVSDALAKLQAAYNKVGEAEGNTANNNEATSGDKGKLDEEPKMGESYVVFGAIALYVVLAVIVNSRKRARR